MITPSGEICSGLKDLKDRAIKAFTKMKKNMGTLFQQFPLVSLKLFDTLIRPILLYASDFWGILKLPANNPIENVHRMFCKHLLGVQKQTTNVAVLLELGQIPLTLYAIKMAIKNWERINSKKGGNLITTSYESSLLENLTWPNSIRSKLAEIGMSVSFWGDRETHKKAFTRMSDIFHQESFSALKESSKLKTYQALKTDIGLEAYLTIINSNGNRKILSKFRLSNHNLMIEKGRHQNINKNLRFCPFCPKHIEDEFHFLLECPCYTAHREELLNSIKEITHRDVLYITDKSKLLVDLLSNIVYTPYTAKFLSNAFHTREHLLRNYKNLI